MRTGTFVATIVLVMLPGTDIRAQVPEGGPAAAIRYEIKSTGLLAHGPDAPGLFPEQNTGGAYWRFRFEPTFRTGAFTVEAAIEPRARIFSGATGDVGGIVVEAPAPWRVFQLDWSVGAGEHAESRVEIDRAAVHARLHTATVTVGRQAIGWGRGVLFGAVDLFSPFSPFDPDREWRRGVDAARADVKLADRVSLDVVTAIGDRRDASIYAARLRGFAGRADLELVGGRRARDLFGGVTSSVAVGGAALYGEAAVFRLPPDSSALLAPAVAKALAGVSWRVPLGSGLPIVAEYHYSGFGAPTAAVLARYLADPDISARYARGDMQILSRHAVAVLGTYERSPETACALRWVQSPRDGSGVVVPSLTLTFSDRTSLLISLQLPYGRPPEGTIFQSDFGASPLGLFSQLRIYR